MGMGSRFADEDIDDDVGDYYDDVDDVDDVGILLNEDYGGRAKKISHLFGLCHLLYYKSAWSSWP